jgi:predicted RNA-binding Zn-ribbon protein involved in translation (DUF1610 family)
MRQGMARQLTVQDFFDQFPDDQACLDHLMKVRFGHLTACPKCGREWRFHKLRKEAAYACQWCGHHVHPMVGTPFQRTRTPLQKWFYAMHLFTTFQGNVSAKELQRQLGVTYKTAWRIGDQIRKHADTDGRLADYAGVGQIMVGDKHIRDVRKKGATAKSRTCLNVTAITPDTQLKQTPSTLRFYGDQFVFDTVSGMFYRMNPTACFILRALDAGVDSHELPALLRSNYTLDASTATRDVELFLNNLAALEPLNRLHPNKQMSA